MLAVIGYLSYDTARMLLIAQKVFYVRNNGEVKGYPEIAAAALVLEIPVSDIPS